MKEIMMKARSGVTLVELLVVILIVTILSVSMLPLLQPFVTEAQYAAEAIPVIGNLRTKIGLSQYDRGKLPGLGTTITTTTTGQGQQQGTPIVKAFLETWAATGETQGQGGQGTATTGIVDPSASDIFAPAYCTLPSGHDYAYSVLNIYDDSNSPVTGAKHFSKLIDVDYQELKGKRSKPVHYQYLVLMNGADYVYFVGCFGDGNGLRMGTGYAVCEIQLKGHKYVGTWKRYKAYSTENQISFTTDTASVDNDAKHTYGCYVPKATDFSDATAGTDGRLSVISTMETYGWEF